MSAAAGRALDIETPRKFVPLLQSARYKCAHGGRGSTKSHFFAEMLVEECMLVPGTRAVGIREVQKSLAQSSKRTIEQKIEKHGLTREFDIQKSEIKTPGGGVIIFQGMQNHTADSIKSLEGFRIAWVDEAQSFSATSLRLLRPTLRMKQSQLWFSWNPRSPEDPVDDFFAATAKNRPFRRQRTSGKCRRARSSSRRIGRITRGSTKRSCRPIRIMISGAMLTCTRTFGAAITKRTVRRAFSRTGRSIGSIRRSRERFFMVVAISASQSTRLSG